ncbi:MarR family transcriptional regulator [Christensenellaceae bacterium OttesenSCG-928-M15]|nr:MarR family transcriptional regulator [Christensenellaceae bacterium OttesenSCG-928-M15]
MSFKNDFLQIFYISQKMRQDFQKHVEGVLQQLSKEYALNKAPKISHYWIFSILYYESPISLTDMAKQTGFAAPNLSRAIFELQDMGLVTKEDDAADHRRCLLSLSEKGLAFCESLRGYTSRFITGRLFHGLMDDVPAVAEFFRAVEHNIEQEYTP